MRYHGLPVILALFVATLAANGRGEARALLRNNATVARINALWRTHDLGDDLYTIGKCVR